ncbi:glycosyltransferase family 39 protein [Candidatus Woesebacteria bacterium]|nr:glycosyltransferase family 39 protein [Candidatus Woesebacteria bacterium]
MLTKSTLVILLLFTLIGAIFRFYNLTSLPPGLLQDEVIAGYDAYALGLTGKDHHGVLLPLIFQSFNDWTMPILTYLLIPFMKFGGLTAFCLRFPIALLSILTIPLIYWFSYRLFESRSVSIFAALFATVSSFSITAGRWSIPPNTVLPIFLLGTNCLLQARTTGKLRWLMLGSLFLGLSIYTYPSLKLFLPLYLFILFYFLSPLFSKKVILALLPLAIAFPLYYLNVTDFSRYNNRFSMVSVFHHAGNWPLTYAANYLSYLLPGNLFLSGEVNPTRTVPGFGYELIGIGVFFYWGLITLAWKLVKKRCPNTEVNIIKFIISFFAIAPIGPALTVPAGDFQRTIYILPFVLAVSAYGFVNLIAKASAKLRIKNWKIALIFSGLVIGNFFLFWSKYTGTSFREINEWYYQDGLNKVFQILHKYESDATLVFVDTTINTPYAYYLFYNSVDPRTLNYRDFYSVGSNGWLKVDAIGKYHFLKIDDKQIANAKLLEEIANSPWSVYRIYQKNQELFVVFVKIRNGSPLTN